MNKANRPTEVSKAGRHPVDLKLDGALGRVLNEALHTKEVAATMNVLVEDRGLIGTWALQITSARLIPIEPKADST